MRTGKGGVTVMPRLGIGVLRLRLAQKRREPALRMTRWEEGDCEAVMPRLGIGVLRLRLAQKRREPALRMTRWEERDLRSGDASAGDRGPSTPARAKTARTCAQDDTMGGGDCEAVMPRLGIGVLRLRLAQKRREPALRMTRWEEGDLRSGDASAGNRGPSTPARAKAARTCAQDDKN